MITDDRVMQLFDRANPVPDVDRMERPASASAYLDRLEQRGNTMTLTAIRNDAPEGSGPDEPRSRTWLYAAAAAAVLVLIAGVIFVGSRPDDTVPADRPDVTVPPVEPDDAGAGDPAPEVVLPLELPVTVTYLDFEWTIDDVSVTRQADPVATTADGDPETDYVQVDITITNPASDFGIRQMSHRGIVRLGVPGSGLVHADQIWNEAGEPQLGPLNVDAGVVLGRRWSFPIPTGTDPSALTVQIGLEDDEARPQIVPFAGPAPTEPGAAVVFAQPSFSAAFPSGDVTFTIGDATASLDRGVADDGTALPPQGNDRRARPGQVFMIVELTASAATDVAVPAGAFTVSVGATSSPCATDAPETFGPEPTTFVVSCTVTKPATSIALEVVDGDTVVGSVDVDPVFTQAFPG